MAFADNTLELQLSESLKQVKNMQHTNGVLNGLPAPPVVLTGPDVYRSINQVSKAISRDGISKAGKNQQQGYSFRGIDDIYNALSALIADAELCILPRMNSRTQEERPTAKGGTLFYVTVQADFDFVSARDGSRHTVTMYGEAMDSADKATNKAMSAAYKYACLQVFCIPTEGMADADANTPQPGPKRPPPTISPAIDTGGHPVGTQAAADHVAQTKIAAGKPAKPNLGTTRGDARRAFLVIRERLGEVVFLTELGRYNCKTIADLNELLVKAPAKAQDCFNALCDLMEEVR